MADEKILEGERGDSSSVEQGNGGQGGEQNSREFTITTGPETAIEGGKEQLEGKLNEILAQATSSSQNPADVTGTHALDAKSISESTDEESKIQKLIDLAGTKGLAHAVNVARSLGDYYALDRMHDELVDKFYEGLLAKGLITKE